MNRKSHQFLSLLLPLVLYASLFPLDAALAQRGRGGGRSFSGGGSFSRSGGASPRMNSNVNLQNQGNFSSPSSSQFQQNRSTIDSSQFQQNRQTNQQTRQSTVQQNQQNRQTTQQERQGEVTQNRQTNQQTRQSAAQQNQQTRQSAVQQNQQNRQTTQQERQGEITERTEIRQEEAANRQNNRQDYVDDNYHGGGWYGGGWYGGGYNVPPGWGWATFTTGLVIGSTVATAPPYYSTVYVDRTPYIYSDGVYMQSSGGSYVVVAPPAGAVVSYLPDGCKTTQINKITYYNCSDIYYQPFYQNGTTVYTVVKL